VRLNDLIFKALSAAMPDQICAGTKAMQCHAGFGGLRFRRKASFQISGDTDEGKNTDPPEYYCFLETLAGGYGARSRSDGPDAVQTHGQNTENAPVEETESNYPVRIVRYGLVPDSEGAGKFRGGVGMQRDYLFPEPATFTVLADRDKAGPHGLFGGLQGSVSEYLHVPAGGKPRKLISKTTVQLQPGDVISYRTSGGGGFGDPAERDPALVLKDVCDGKVSAARARDVYRVKVAPGKTAVDAAATARLRSRRRTP
jgi:N-methylhydantoinase B